MATSHAYHFPTGPTGELRSLYMLMEVIILVIISEFWIHSTFYSTQKRVV